jgi:hypothetical protein
VDVLFRILHLEEEELRDHEIGDVIIDARADENDAILEESRINIVAALTATGLFDNDGNEHGMRL